MILRSGTCSRSNPRSGFVRLRIGFFIVLGHVSKFGVIVFAYIIPQISLNKILHTNRIHTQKKNHLSSKNLLMEFDHCFTEFVK